MSRISPGDDAALATIGSALKEGRSERGRSEGGARGFEALPAPLTVKELAEVIVDRRHHPDLLERRARRPTNCNRRRPRHRAAPTEK